MGAEGLAYDDPQSDSDATVMVVNGLLGCALSLHDEAANPPPHTLRCVALHMLGLPLDYMPPLEAAGMPSRCMWTRLSWTTSEPEAHGQASCAMEDTLLNVS